MITAETKKAINELFENAGKELLEGNNLLGTEIGNDPYKFGWMVGYIAGISDVNEVIESHENQEKEEKEDDTNS